MEETQGKKLGFFPMTMLVIGATVGSGIFDLSFSLSRTASPGAALIAWAVVATGILMLCLSLINLMKKRPDLTGIFAYAEEGFGPLGGFISGWGYWMSGWLGNIAFATIMMVALGNFFPILGTSGNSWLAILVASAVLWIMFLLTSHGIEEAVLINAVVTAAKVIALAMFIVFAIGAFRAHIFTVNFWGNFADNVTNDTGFSAQAVFQQIQNSMVSLMFVFVGVEAAAMMSRRAKNQNVAMKATIFGLIGPIILNVLITMLPYGILPASEIVALGEPAAASMLGYIIGPIGENIVNAGLILSVFGSWLTCTIVPCENIRLMAEDRLLPKVFGELNVHGSPAFTLLITTILSQLFIISLHFTDSAYSIAYSMCTAAIFLTWLCVTAFQVQYTWGHKQEPHWIANLAIGVAGTVFFIWCISTSGINYVLLCFALYVIGFFFFYYAREKYKLDITFRLKEAVGVILISCGAAVSVTLLIV